MFRTYAIILVAVVMLGTLAPITTAAKEPVVLRMTVAEELSSLNPLVGNSLVDWWVFNLIYDKLAIYGTDLKPMPWLAESWEVSEDGTTWTLHLVKNATWHDGTPFTAADVVFTINYIKEWQVSLWMDEVQDIKQVEAVDDYTVKIVTDEPIAYLDTYVFPRLPILPKHVWEAISNPEKYPNTHPVGIGPFMLDEYKPGEYIKFKANSHYWKGRPKIDEIIAEIGLTPDSAFLKLKSGELDIMLLQPTYVDQAKSLPNVKVVMTEDIYFDYIVLNTKRYPLNIKDFRRALSMAIDKQDLINRVLLGYGEPLYSVIPPAYKFWHNPNVTKYSYDADKAKALLDSLGFKDSDKDGFRETPDGKDFELNILTLSTWPPYIRMADLLKTYFEAVGIKTTITSVEWGEESSKLHNRDYDIAIWGYTVAPEPSQFLSLFTNNPPPYWSMGEWSNQTYNQLFEEQKHVMNLDQRRTYIYKLQEILAEELPIIPIWMAYVIEAYRSDHFTGWVTMPMGILGIYNKLTWLSVRPVTATTTTTTSTTTTTPPQSATTSTTTPPQGTATSTTPTKTSPTTTQGSATTAPGGGGIWIGVAVVVVIIVIVGAYLLLRRR